MYSIFSSNSEADVSDLLENLVEMLPLYDMDASKHQENLEIYIYYEETFL